MEHITDSIKSEEFIIHLLRVLYTISTFLFGKAIEAIIYLFLAFVWLYLMVIKWSIYLFISVIAVAFLNQ